MKGAISTITLAILGTFTTIAIAVSTANYNTNSNQDKVLLNHESRIATTEARLERLPIIEKKLDTLLERQGVNPSKVEQQLLSQNGIPN